MQTPLTESGDARDSQPDVDCAAKTTVPVLISAEPDNAEAIAQVIHRRGIGNAPFVTVNCAGPTHRVAAQLDRLLGRPTERGTRRGRRTVFFREICEMDAVCQARLRDWFEKVARRPGAPRNLARIIASSSADLYGRVEARAFDASLFYRVNVIHIKLEGRR